MVREILARLKELGFVYAEKLLGSDNCIYLDLTPNGKSHLRIKSLSPSTCGQMVQ